MLQSGILIDFELIASINDNNKFLEFFNGAVILKIIEAAVSKGFQAFYNNKNKILPHFICAISMKGKSK